MSFINGYFDRFFLILFYAYKWPFLVPSLRKCYTLGVLKIIKIINLLPFMNRVINEDPKPKPAPKPMPGPETPA